MPELDRKGAFLLATGDSIQFHIEEQRFQIELQRAVERDKNRVVKWETLDIAQVPFSRNLFVCMGAASRDGDSSEYVAVAEEDIGDPSPVKFAWKVDLVTRKLIPSDPAGIRCSTSSE